MAAATETIILFGATGDLAQRMLFPSLFNLHSDGLLADGMTIVGSGRSVMDSAAFRDQVAQGLADHLPADRLDKTVVAAFLARV